MKNIIKNTFSILLFVYSFLILFSSLGIISKYSLQFNLFALFIALIGIFVIDPKESKNEKNLYLIFLLSLFFILSFRIIPYLNNSIPLGYDTGIYKYTFESYKNDLPQQNWEKAGMEPGLFILGKLFYFLGLETQQILIPVFILFCVLLGFLIYLITKEYFGKKSAFFSVLFYSVSVVQFKTFAMMYYKTIFALSLLLLSFFYLKNQKFFLLILTGIMLGITHKQTFFLFGLSFLLFIFSLIIKSKSIKSAKPFFISGFVIFIFVFFAYLPTFEYSILPYIKPIAKSFIEPGTSPGTFITFFQYQFLSLSFLPLVILGLFILIKQKNFNIIFFSEITLLIIVYFQFFFFNRFIIHLDILAIILASISIDFIPKNNLSRISMFLLILSALILIYNASISSRPLILQEELKEIQILSQTEQNSYVLSISSKYSPWLLGYSKRKTIAPGLFDYDKHNKTEWLKFQKTNNITQIRNFLDEYEKPLYIFSPESSHFKNECFQNYSKMIYKYIC